MLSPNQRTAVLDHIWQLAELIFDDPETTAADEELLVLLVAMIHYCRAGARSGEALDTCLAAEVTLREAPCRGRRPNYPPPSLG